MFELKERANLISLRFGKANAKFVMFRAAIPVRLNDISGSSCLQVFFFSSRKKKVCGKKIEAYKTPRHVTPSIMSFLEHTAR
jgi:hypothetical protein